MRLHQAEQSINSDEVRLPDIRVCFGERVQTSQRQTKSSGSQRNKYQEKTI